MKNLYIIDIYEGTVTGLTTYKQELSACLYSCSDVRLFQIILNYPSDEFSIKTHNGIISFQIPSINEHCDDVTGFLLQLYIEDSPDSVFIQNFSPTYPLVRILRESFPKSKIIIVIHDFMWATYLMGDINRFKRIIRGKEADFQNSLITSLYKDGTKTYPLCDKIVCLSEDTYNLLKDFYQVDSSKLDVIPNGLRDVSYVDTSCNIRSLYGISENEKILLYVGRVSRQKGTYDMLASFRDVLSVIPQCRLVIAGNIDSYFIAGISPEVRLKVLLLGILSKERLYKWYKTADVGVQPSYYEQCSYTGIEMKMFGLPIVASDGFGLSKMFNSGNAVIASIGDYQQPFIYQRNLTAALIKILSSGLHKSSFFRKQSLLHFKETYTSTKMTDAYKALLQSL